MVTIYLLAACLCLCGAQEWVLDWSDEFDGDEINTTTWQHEVTMWGGGNGEFETYTPDPENSFVRDGYLWIKPTLLRDNINPQTGEPFGQDFIYEGAMDLEEVYGVCTNSENNGCYREGKGYGNDTEIPPIASARLRSWQGFSYRYGKAHVRARMPVGDWLWPAVWYLPENWCYGEWPLSGEFDLTESKGNEDLRFEDGEWHGMQTNGNTMHWGPAPEANAYMLTHGGVVNETYDYGRYFHDYIVEWTPDSIIFYIDGEETLSIPDGVMDEGQEWEGFWVYGNFSEDDYENPWETCNDPLLCPFDTQFHFLMNIAVGCTNYYISDDAINRGGDPAYQKPWTNGVSQVEAMNDFYDAEEGWYWTWEKEGDLNAMQVDFIRVYKRADLPDESDPDCPA